MDVARWHRPVGAIGDPSSVRLGRTLRLYYRHVGLRCAVWLRIGQWFRRHGVRGGAFACQRLIYRRYGLDIVIGRPFGGGLYIAHPSGVTLAPRCMGENCSVIAAVTVGMRNEHEFPEIGDRVFLGAGARVIGEVTLGDDAQVGANAVVVHDVDPGTTVVGIPAKPLSRTEPT